MRYIIIVLLLVVMNTYGGESIHVVPKVLTRSEVQNARLLVKLNKWIGALSGAIGGAVIGGGAVGYGFFHFLHKDGMKAINKDSSFKAAEKGMMTMFYLAGSGIFSMGAGIIAGIGGAVGGAIAGKEINKKTMLYVLSKWHQIPMDVLKNQIN